VGANLFKELDYHLEASNMAQFDRAHQFLGFVTTPEWLPQYTGPRGTAQVLTMGWVHGSHIRDLAPPQQVRYAVRGFHEPVHISRARRATHSAIDTTCIALFHQSNVR
jgi:hypothetical protein